MSTWTKITEEMPEQADEFTAFWSPVWGLMFIGEEERVDLQQWIATYKVTEWYQIENPISC